MGAGIAKHFLSSEPPSESPSEALIISYIHVHPKASIQDNTLKQRPSKVLCNGTMFGSDRINVFSKRKKVEKWFS